MSVHEKPGTFCSRKCANSRRWTDADKLKKSQSAKASEKVAAVERNIIKALTGKLEHSATKHYMTVEEYKQSSFYRVGEFAARLTRGCKSCGKREGLRKHCGVCDNCRTLYYKFYRPQCEFKFSLSQYPKLFDGEVIKIFGMYSPENKRNNKNGISRDHKLSVKDAFNLRLHPDIVKHPANCQLVRHVENQQKGTRSIITLEQLIQEIEIIDGIKPVKIYMNG